MINYEEHALAFQCEGDWLYSVLSLPKQSASTRGVLILIGGPQYRAGSHRQFTLLSRNLAEYKVPVFRFDVRGMGDSEGDIRTFEDVAKDMRCAIDRFLKEVPLLKQLVILGLCDAASAALFYAHQDSRVTGLILLNPWVRTDEGSAKVYLKHYYTARLFQQDFWAKVWNGNFDYVRAAQSFFRTVGIVAARQSEAGAVPEKEPSARSCDRAPLPDRMLYGLSRFKGEILLILSGNDLTAQEFSELVKSSREWQKVLASSQVSRFNLPDANHTFSRREWRNQVALRIRNWMHSW